MAESYPNGVENTVVKGEIAHYEQFLFFPQCFQKACFPGASKGVLVWEWVKHLLIQHLPDCGVKFARAAIGAISGRPTTFCTG